MFPSFPIFNLSPPVTHRIPQLRLSFSGSTNVVTYTSQTSQSVFCDSSSCVFDLHTHVLGRLFEFSYVFYQRKPRNHRVDTQVPVPGHCLGIDRKKCDVHAFQQANTLSILSRIQFFEKKGFGIPIFFSYVVFF